MRRLLLAFVLCTTACGAAATRRFPLKEPLWQDTDTRSVRVPCWKDPSKKDPEHVSCTPEPYVSPLAWDAADNTIFRPLSQVFAVAPGGESVDVNAMDEVPNSSWFTNRIGTRPMSEDEIFRGPCRDLIDEKDYPDGSWVIDQGKANGATPGFRVNIAGLGKFMLKSDLKEQPERPSAASAIGMRLYHAIGFNVPCDAVVWFDPKVLSLTPGLESIDNTGIPKKFDAALLQWILGFNVRKGPLVRMQSSQWLPGKTLGPFKYEGTRDGDPNDVVPHQDRRELRAARLLAAWLNHFDAREQNTMTTWVADDPKDDHSPGWVRHWYLDVSDCFGSEWPWDEISRRLGHSYYLDFEHVGEDFITFGLWERPWHRAKKDPVGNIFGYYSARDFDPERWQAGYPNPAFSRMTELDGAWITRLLARLSPQLIRTAVRTGRFSKPEQEEYLHGVVLARHRAILRRYLSRLSPVTDVVAKGHEVCAVDLARRSGVFPETNFVYVAKAFVGERYQVGRGIDVTPKDDGAVCWTVGDPAPEGGSADDDLSRYRIVDVTNGHAKGALRMHFYDLGPKRGLQLVGIERPEGTEPPS
jgi:hypothetical protein